MAAAELTVCGGITARLYRISFSGELAYEIGVPARYGDALARALMEAGAPFGIAPYGTEALGVMRIEKGHVAGNELDGRTTAHDLGLGRMMSTKKDYIGRVHGGPPGAARSGRARASSASSRSNRGARLRAGAHLVPLGAAAAAANDQGVVTSVAFSPRSATGSASACSRAGRERIGERVLRPIRCATARSRSRFARPASSTRKESGCVAEYLTAAPGWSISLCRAATARAMATPGVTMALRRDLALATVMRAPEPAAGARARVREVFGLNSPTAAMRDRRSGRFAWAGPGHGSPGDGADGTAFEHRLRGRWRSRVGHRPVGRPHIFACGGPKARDALAKGVPIDLHPRVFRPGDAAVTSAHIGVHLWQVDDAPTYELIVPRSFAVAFREWFDEAAAEFGYVPSRVRLADGVVAQIGIEHAGIVGQRAEHALHQDAPVLHGVGSVSHPQRIGGHLLDQQDRQTFANEIDQHREQEIEDLRGEPERRRRPPGAGGATGARARSPSVCCSPPDSEPAAFSGARQRRKHSRTRTMSAATPAASLPVRR